MIINVGDKIQDKKGREGTITNIGIATEMTDVAAEADTSLNAQTYDTLLNYTGAITFGSNWCYFEQIEKVLESVEKEESATDWIDK
jgi:ABC-type transport system involved in Fe-S cluster assembly fused permease/ATPase subunit